MRAACATEAIARLAEDDRAARTGTGVRRALEGLTLAADDLARDRYGQKAIVSVRQGDALCYSDRLNFDQARQREQFVARLRRVCAAADGDHGGPGPLSLLARQVTEAVLIELGDACRRRSTQRSSARDGADGWLAAANVARPLLDDADVLIRVGEAMRANGYAGPLAPALLAFVALTSRLLDRPINLGLVAPPAAGKNATLDAALALVPPDAVYEFTASSPMALIYAAEDFRHRVVLFTEADSIPARGPAAAAIRALAEGQTLRYGLPMRDPATGAFATYTIIREGPTGLITTSTRPLPPPLHSRLLPVTLDDDPATTYSVLRAKGERAAGLRPSAARAPFLALQDWLAHGGERRVLVPFGAALARAVGGTGPLELRLRRDFDSLLSCIRTIALLRQCQRPPAPGGEVEATIDDYRLARELLWSSFSAADAEALPAVLRDLVGAIGSGEEVTRTELIARVGKPRSTVYWQVSKALERHALVERMQGRTGWLRCDGPLPAARPPLPDPAEVDGFFWGVPAPRRSEAFDDFVHALAKAGRAGVTAHEWAARVQRPLEGVRARLDALVTAGTLDYDANTARYALRVVVTVVRAVGRTTTTGPAAASPPGAGGSDNGREGVDR